MGAEVDSPQKDAKEIESPIKDLEIGLTSMEAPVRKTMMKTSH
jgi:hypothetical protein